MTENTGVRYMDDGVRGMYMRRQWAFYSPLQILGLESMGQ